MRVECSTSIKKRSRNVVLEAGDSVGCASIVNTTANGEAPFSARANQRPDFIKRHAEGPYDHVRIFGPRAFPSRPRLSNPAKAGRRSVDVSNDTKMAAVRGAKDEQWRREHRCFRANSSSFLADCTYKIIFFRHLEYVFSQIILVQHRIGVSDTEMRGFQKTIFFAIFAI